MLESGERIIQETRGWDEAAGVTHSMRSKEQAHDYRYFPDPDLVPMEIDRRPIERFARDAAGIADRALRALRRRIQISVAQATQLVDNASLAAYFDRAVAIAQQRRRGVVNFVLGDLSRLANEHGVEVAHVAGNAGSVGRTRRV